MMPGTLESKPNSVWTCARWLDLVGSDATLVLAIRSARSLGKVSHIGLAGGSTRMKPLGNASTVVLIE
jgi:hypothetical protein